jgi:hypothetical protein
VGQGVRRVGVLVDVRKAVRLGVGELARSEPCSVRALGGIGHDDLRAVGVEDALALGPGRRGQAEGHSEAERGAQHGVGNAGVAARGVEEPPARQETAPVRVNNDPSRGAILHAAAGILRLELRVHGDAFRRETAERDEGSLPDAPEQRVFEHALERGGAQRRVVP